MICIPKKLCPLKVDKLPKLVKVNISIPRDYLEKVGDVE